MNPLSRPEGDSSPEKGSFGGRKEVKKMENKKARMKRAQRKALVNCEGNRSFTAAYRDCPQPEGQSRDKTTVFVEDDPLCATMDNLCAALDIWKETLNNPWQRADREYMKKLAGDVQELLRMTLMDEEALAAKYTESCPKSADRDRK